MSARLVLDQGVRQPVPRRPVNLLTPNYVYMGISVSAEGTAAFRELKV
jgi:hypothetical protein